MNILILPLLTLVVYGPTQFGKTTFIKRLGGAVVEKPKETGRSVTTVPTIYNFNMTWPNDNSIQPISIIDLPGLDDTELALSNELIGKSIHVLMSQRAVPKIDAFLLFNSLRESSTKVMKTMFTFATAVHKAVPSVVFVLSKADMAENNTIGLKETAIEDCKSLRVLYVEWSDYANETGMQIQFAKLRTAIAEVTPFKEKDLEEMNKKIHEKAVELQQQDPKRYTIQTIVTKVLKTEIYWDEEKYTETIQVPKYDSTELIEKAIEMQKKNTIPKTITENFVEERYIRKPVYEEICFLFFCFGDIEYINAIENVLETRTKEILVEQPFETFVEQLQKETVPEHVEMTRKVQKTRETIVDHKEDVKIERYSFEHYLEEARQVMINEMWKTRNSTKPSH